ncbi:MAG: DUF4097 family beta strand repeat protein [Clostridia bacterium]|nr:DUF4097 family beta strand repeat protein [Clostridia bacterium]
MKKSLIIGAILVITGITFIIGAVIHSGFDISKFETIIYTTITYAPEGDFNKIDIDTHTTDIVLKKSENGNCKIVCSESEHLKYSASIENGVLSIKTADSRKWYEYFTVFSLKRPMTLYLPENQYDSITINSRAGDISLSGIICTGDITVNVSTGDVILSDLTCNNLYTEGSTGDTTLKNTVASGSFNIRRSTGDVEFENSDASSITVKTSTGDVTGTLKTQKTFITDTSTGNIRVPSTASSEKCEIKTSTGDIIISIQ